MHAAIRSSLAALALCLLAACGGGSSSADEDAAQAADEAAAEERGRDTDKTVFDDMIQTQDKARAVEGVTLGHKQELDDAIEASSGDAAAAAEE
jgi:basic membrane lipoprotein Med (substrate-binding protein (PBP1-ABC) superfamily)